MKLFRLLRERSKSRRKNKVVSVDIEVMDAQGRPITVYQQPGMGPVTIYGTLTGRTPSREPNFSNVPRVMGKNPALGMPYGRDLHQEALREIKGPDLSSAFDPDPEEGPDVSSNS